MGVTYVFVSVQYRSWASITDSRTPKHHHQGTQGILELLTLSHLVVRRIEPSNLAQVRAMMGSRDGQAVETMTQPYRRGLQVRRQR